MGRGGSERHPRDVSRAAYVADVVAVAEQLGLERPVLVGQSLGGHTALLTAAAHPDLVRSLVLVEAGPGGPSPDIQTDIGAWLDSWPTPFPSRRAAAEFFGGGRRGDGWAAGLEQRPDGWWPRFDRDVMVAPLAELAQRSFWDEWSSVTCPTLAVFGRRSFLAPQEIDGMFHRRPDLRAVSVPGTGHDVHLDHPEALRSAVTGFLDADLASGAP